MVALPIRPGPSSSIRFRVKTMLMLLKVHVNQVFQGAVDSIAQIEGLWLIDYANSIKISSDDEFGKLNDVSINGATISIQNDDTFTLTKNSDQEIGQGMFFKVADSNDLRYYPFVEQTIGNGSFVTEPSTSAVANNTSVVAPTNATNVTAPSGGEAPVVNGTTPGKLLQPQLQLQTTPQNHMHLALVSYQQSWDCL